MTAQGSASSAIVVADDDTVAKAQATVRSVLDHGGLLCLVVDLHGKYVAVADEQVVSLAELASALGLAAEVTVSAATLDPDELTFYAGVLGAAHAQSRGRAEGLLVLGAGMLVLDDLRAFVAGSEVLVSPYTDPAGARLRAGALPGRVRRASGTGLLALEEPDAAPLYCRSAYTVRTARQIELLRELAADWRTASTALDIFAVAVGATRAADPVLVSPWRAIGPTSFDPDGHLCVDGARVCLVDLTAFDAGRPWTLDASTDVPPRVLLSEHPALAEVVRAEVDRRADVESRTTRTATAPAAGARWDAILRSEARRAPQPREGPPDLPDLLGLGVGDDVATWALRLIPEGHPRPVARYLQAVRSARLDLQRAHREVPGQGSSALARWALKSGVGKPALDTELLARAAEATLAAQPGAASRSPVSTEETLPPGVNLVGYLTGEMGLGESARLVDDALQRAGVPTTTYDVGWALESRRGATYRRSEPVLRRTTVICMNGAETAAAADRLTTFTERTRVIGMWYDELEQLAPRHEAGFEHVHEVWAATDFVRDAIARSAPEGLTVRTVTPPLPQALPALDLVPPSFGIPQDRPWFLFTFDFFSSAERKNPYGLVDAFTRAFGDRPADERPLLVLKTVNADRCPGDAERLRVQIAGRPDVLHLNTYLDHDIRHVLVASCTAYVSLHKAEGLGLTVAEAMAWGRPVITTAYGGVTQFCTEQNAFLVDWEYGRVEQARGPYVRGTPWAEPDLQQAAALMRLVLDEPERAAVVGGRAARDIRDLHNADTAGAWMKQVLEEGDERWRAERRSPPASTDSPGPSSLVRRIGGAVARRARR